MVLSEFEMSAPAAKVAGLEEGIFAMPKNATAPLAVAVAAVVEEPMVAAQAAEAAPPDVAGGPTEPEAPAPGGSDVTAAPIDAAVLAPDGADAPPELKRRGRPRTKVEDVVVGTPYHGKVVGLAKFGAFVDIGAMTDGLVHITELPKKGVRRVEDVLKSGESVDVWVKEIDVAGGKISLTMRRPAPRPIGSLAEGDVLVGRVTTVAKYGVFVDIESDTEGLVHISEMSSGFVQRAEDIVKNGDAVEVRIKEIDPAKQRISLTMKGLANDTGVAVVNEATAVDPRAGATDDAPPAEPEERMPTVVELALRRALGEAEAGADAGAKPQPAKAGARPANTGALSDVYNRMLEEYRATKAADK